MMRVALTLFRRIREKEPAPFSVRRPRRLSCWIAWVTRPRGLVRVRLEINVADEDRGQEDRQAEGKKPGPPLRNKVHSAA